MINKFHPSLSQEKFDRYDQKTQSLMIAAEIARAETWAIRGNVENLKSCLDRAFELIDLAVSSLKWARNRKKLLYFRDSLASIYENPPQSPIFQIFYYYIINLNINDEK